jgi:hypothetical protein
MSIKWSIQERDYVRFRRGIFPQVGDFQLLLATKCGVETEVKIDLNRFSSIFLEGFF